MKRLVSLAVVLIMISPLLAQSAAEYRSKINTLVENHDYVAALENLQKFREQDRKIFELNNYDYLLGRMAEKTSDVGVAMAGFQSVDARDSILRSYAQWHLAQIARSTGNLMLERLTLLKLLSASPGLLSSAANHRLARSFFESKNYAEAVRLLTAPSQYARIQPLGGEPKSPGTGLAREDLRLLADAYALSNKTTEARDAYNTLLNEMPNPAQPDDLALAAAKALDLLDNATVSPISKLADTEHLRRASIFQFNRDFADARMHYMAIVRDYPQSGIVPDALYQIGRGYAQQSDYAEAIKWFQRVQEGFPDHPSAKDALTQSASGYSKTGKYKEAIDLYKKFIDLYPNDEREDRAYLNIVDVYRDMGDEDEALKSAANTEQAFKGKLPEAVAVFTKARIYLARADWLNGLASLDRLKTFSDLGGTKVPGGTNLAEVDFLRAFVLEQLRRYDEAIDVYLSIPDGRSEYYGGRATERLRLLATDENARGSIAKKAAALALDSKSKDAEMRRLALQSLLRLTDAKDERAKLLDPLRAVYKELPVYQKVPSFKMLEIGRRELLTQTSDQSSKNNRIGDELLFLGLYDEAAPEIEASMASKDSTGDSGYTLAVIYNRGDTANRGVAFIEPLWRNVPADYQIDLISRDQFDLLYPAPYIDALLKYAPSRQVDPRFMLSIIRQESRYRAQVKSYAAARGLMQFISTTSDTIAGEVGRSDFKQDELYDPSTAILFGSQYLADLFKLFPDQPAAVAASYNGGDDNMKRWLGRSKSNVPDRYVPEIVFSQSKDYVYKVMANYRMYQMIRNEDLSSR